MIKVVSIKNDVLSFSSSQTNNKKNISAIHNSFSESSPKTFEYLTFKGNINTPQIFEFKTTKWDNAKSIFDKTEIINGEIEYVNIVDFINRGKDSKLARNIPVLRASFNYCQPFKIRSEETTVGKHIQDVVSHLYYDNDEFENLSENDKKLLLKVAVFHDIGKKENKLCKSDLTKPDFEAIIRKKIRDYNIFNEPSRYISAIIAFFETHPDEQVIILHNNKHRYKSKELIKEYIIGTPEQKKELEEIELLVLNHEIFGDAIDRFSNKFITKAEFDSYPEIFAKAVPDKRLLKLIKIFHLSDASGVYKTNPEYYKSFKNSLEKIYKETISNV